MTKSLVIVESPSKAKTIQKYLGQGYTVLASGGHVCDLPQKTLGIDVEHGFEPEYEINPEKKKPSEDLNPRSNKTTSCISQPTPTAKEKQ